MAGGDSADGKETLEPVFGDKVFETIMMRPVPRDEIDRVRSAISQIDEEGVLLTDGVRRAEADLEAKGQEADKAHARGMAVNVWTVNDEADIRKSLEAGADMLIGDYPDRMLRIREELSNGRQSK